jgi:hypothetical protein
MATETPNQGSPNTQPKKGRRKAGVAKNYHTTPGGRVVPNKGRRNQPPDATTGWGKNLDDEQNGKNGNMGKDFRNWWDEQGDELSKPWWADEHGNPEELDFSSSSTRRLMKQLVQAGYSTAEIDKLLSGKNSGSLLGGLNGPAGNMGAILKQMKAGNVSPEQIMAYLEAGQGMQAGNQTFQNLAFEQLPGFYNQYGMNAMNGRQKQWEKKNPGEEWEGAQEFLQAQMGSPNWSTQGTWADWTPPDWYKAPPPAAPPTADKGNPTPPPATQPVGPEVDAYRFPEDYGFPGGPGGESPGTGYTPWTPPNFNVGGGTSSPGTGYTGGYGGGTSYRPSQPQTSGRRKFQGGSPTSNFNLRGMRGY